MKCCLTVGLLLIATLCVSNECKATDQIDRDVPAFAEPVRWSAQTAVTYLPSAVLGNSSVEAGITDYRLKLVRNFKLDEHLSLSLGVGYGLKHIDAPRQALLPQDLHGLFMEAGVGYQITDRAFVSLKVFPGFYSDLKEMDNDDLRMPLLALGGYSFESGVSLVGGFVYRFGYHAGQYIPAIGISYQPDREWRFDLVLPRPAVTYSPTRQIQLYVAGDFASDEYELNDRSLGAQAFKYSDLKAMAGFNYLPKPNVKLSTSVGYAFERRFMFFNGNRPDLRIDDVPFFKLGLEVGW